MYEDSNGNGSSWDRGQVFCDAGPCKYLGEDCWVMILHGGSTEGQQEMSRRRAVTTLMATHFWASMEKLRAQRMHPESPPYDNLPALPNTNMNVPRPMSNNAPVVMHRHRILIPRLPPPYPPLQHSYHNNDLTTPIFDIGESSGELSSVVVKVYWSVGCLGLSLLTPLPPSMLTSDDHALLLGCSITRLNTSISLSKGYALHSRRRRDLVSCLASLLSLGTQTKHELKSKPNDFIKEELDGKGTVIGRECPTSRPGKRDLTQIHLGDSAAHPTSEHCIVPLDMKVGDVDMEEEYKEDLSFCLK
ncbi:hypothetical protein ARMSODRAFT_976223 [Armillaria solidipes]|uniref:Uncharacterized protein n=1 Tax=Armillaria solidipes TaxID=1076256 RepID=A0A2H3BLR6_9AGAR|nr:hypothetical protein ARMSODRAFT_976223 [Armillaria solidipes]